jgi:hypothetical protein
MSADLNLYVDIARQTLVQGPFSLQPLVSLPLIQAENLSVAAQFLSLTGNGLQPYVNVDPTGWTLQFGVGYIDNTGTKQLVAFATSTALTAISGLSAQTAIVFNLNTFLNAVGTALIGIHSLPIWAELSWAYSGAPTGYANKAQVEGILDTAYIGTGLPGPT